jgi:hypothetical protein
LKKKQIIRGIKAGYDEIVKMMEDLLSPPLIYLASTYMPKGPSILRVLLGLVTQEGVQLPGEGWGRYEYEDSPNGRPEKEQWWYVRLLASAPAAAHWYQQIGLLRDCVQDDLKKLSNAEPATELPTWPLESFKKEYSILFEALHATFGLMPSSSRIAEQVHGGNRDSIRKGVSLDFTDAHRGYVVNEEYGPRSLRRKLERIKSTKEIVKGVVKRVKRTKAVGSINHDNRKYLQQMVRRKILEQSSKYSSHKIKMLPAELLKNATVKNMMKKGALASDKALVNRKVELAAEKLERSTGRRIHTNEEYRDMAKNLKIDNDKTFSEITVEELNRQEDLDKLAHYNFWDTQV